MSAQTTTMQQPSHTAIGLQCAQEVMEELVERVLPTLSSVIHETGEKTGESLNLGDAIITAAPHAWNNRYAATAVLPVLNQGRTTPLRYTLDIHYNHNSDDVHSTSLLFWNDAGGYDGNTIVYSLYELDENWKSKIRAAHFSDQPEEDKAVGGMISRILYGPAEPRHITGTRRTVFERISIAAKTAPLIDAHGEFRKSLGKFFEFKFFGRKTTGLQHSPLLTGKKQGALPKMSTEEATENLRKAVKELGHKIGIELVIEDSARYTGGWLGDWRVCDKEGLGISAEYITVIGSSAPKYRVMWSCLGDEGVCRSERTGRKLLSLEDVVDVLSKKHDRRPMAARNIEPLTREFI